MTILNDTLGGGMDSLMAEILVELWFEDALRNTIRDAKRKFAEEYHERRARDKDD